MIKKMIIKSKIIKNPLKISIATKPLRVLRIFLFYYHYLHANIILFLNKLKIFIPKQFFFKVFYFSMCAFKKTIRPRIVKRIAYFIKPLIKRSDTRSKFF